MFSEGDSVDKDDDGDESVSSDASDSSDDDDDLMEKSQGQILQNFLPKNCSNILRRGMS